jgi:hypothetical protein
MSLTPWLPTIRKIRDGESVEQAVVNVPLEQLAQRDQHLYEKFIEISGKSVLIAVEQPIHPAEEFQADQLQLVYYKQTQDGKEGLAKAYAGFASSSSSSFFKPGNSSYVFGITKTLYTQSMVADVYIEGLCELEINLDDPDKGLIQKISGVVEPFEVGPYYLSASSPGKITKNPSGIPVYVGYALSRNKFLLSSNTDEFSQFFINFRFHVLDRVAGEAEKTGDEWIITSPDTSIAGWIPADNVLGKPEGAVFYYNIPSLAAINEDTSLEDFEKTEAIELQKQLPPIPANFIQFFVNGSLVRYKDLYDPTGYYSVNEYGLWWYKNTDGDQPWSEYYPTATSPAMWTSDIKPDLEAAGTRKRLFTSFAKFNPALRTQLVSSIKPFNIPDTDMSINFVQFFNSDNLTEPSSTGDIYVSVDPKFSRFGYLNSAEADFPTPSVDYTLGKAVADIRYSKASGKFELLFTPSVNRLIGINGIDVMESTENPGVWSIGYKSQSIIGQVDSIEPINARLEFLGLTSYLKLPYPTNTPYGYIGKIVLPSNFTTGKDLRIILQLFGDASVAANATQRKVAFKFQYSVAAVSNVDGARTNTLVTSSSYSLADAEVSLTSTATEAYTAYTAIKIDDAGLVIPAEHIQADSVISFKIVRTFAGVPLENYAGALGVLTTYWEIKP